MKVLEVLLKVVLNMHLWGNRFFIWVPKTLFWKSMMVDLKIYSKKCTSKTINQNSSSKVSIMSIGKRYLKLKFSVLVWIYMNIFKS